MSAKPSRRLFVNRRITGGQHERNWRALSVAGFIFTYVRRYFSGLLTGGAGGGAICGAATVWQKSPRVKREQNATVSLSQANDRG